MNLKAKLSGIGAAALVALLTLSAVSCQKNQQNHAVSASSHISAAESRETSSKESKTESSAAPEKTSQENSENIPSSAVPEEQSQETSEDVSSAESDTASSQEPASESDTESSEEDTEESENSHEESEKPVDTAEAVVGQWTYVNGSSYVNMELQADGTATAQTDSVELFPVGSWQAEGTQVTVQIMGGTAVYNYENDRLTAVENADEVFVRGTTDGSATEKVSEAVVGSWYISRNGNIMVLSLNENGNVVANATELAHPLVGSWTVSGSAVTITLAGENNIYHYIDDKLVSDNNPSEALERYMHTYEGISEALMGGWTFTNGTDYANISLYEDGTMVLETNSLDERLTGTWTVSGNQVTLSISGGNSVYEYVNNTLVNTLDPAQTFVRGTTQAE